MNRSIGAEVLKVGWDVLKDFVGYNARLATRDRSSGFAFITAWYSSQCDGEWEHEFGVKIETIDNPGWDIRIDLADTEVDGLELAFNRKELPGGQWVMASSDGTVFTAACSPGAVGEIDRTFEAFVLSSRAR